MPNLEELEFSAGRRRQAEDLGAEPVLLGSLVLYQVSEDRERSKEMEGRAGVEADLSTDLGHRDPGSVSGHEFEDTESSLEGLNHRALRHVRP